MNSLVQKFIAEQIKKSREILSKYYESTGTKPLVDVKQGEPAYPPEVISARAQLDAFVRVANFIGDNPPKITDHMSNAEAIRTASDLFFNEVNKQDFDWKNGPKTQEEASDLINKYCDGSGVANGFNAVLYYWYHFERGEQQAETT